MEEERPLISVIVPVYNVELYIRKCVESIAAQTYPNFEVIIVDDGSQDEGGRICDDYAAGDKRIQVIHFPENRGLSAARNEGVFRAKGAYAFFVDSDDHVEPGLLEKLYSNLKAGKADISICGIDGMGDEQTRDFVYSREETVCCLGRRTPFLWNVWGKLYPMELVKKHPFDERALCCEDLLFFYQVLMEIRQVSYLPDKLYHYVYRKGSLVNHGIDEKRCTVLLLLDHICVDAARSGPELLPGLSLLALDTNARLAMQAVEGDMPYRELFRYLKRFKRSIRRHFRWKAILLCRDKKTIAAVFLLYAGAAFFWPMAAVFKAVKRFKGGRVWKRRKEA